MFKDDGSVGIRWWSSPWIHDAEFEARGSGDKAYRPLVAKALRRYREAAVAIGQTALLKVGTIAVGKDDEAVASGGENVDF